MHSTFVSIHVAICLVLVTAGAGGVEPPSPVAGQTFGHVKILRLQPGKTQGMANDYRVHSVIGDGGRVIYAPGVFTQSVHFGADSGFTSASAVAEIPAWPPNVVLDGSSGELAWGKSMFLVSGGSANTKATFHTTGTVDGILFQNAGFKDQPSGGAGGAYVDGGGSLIIRNCDFEGNTNGISAQENADLVDVRDSAFSLRRGNGATDERSHDAYVAAARNLFTRIVVGGLGTGNDIKIRAPYGRIDQSFLVASNGRWLDAPWGGDMAVSNSVLIQAPHAASGNMFAYAEEGSNEIHNGDAASGTITFTNDLIVVTRPQTAIMINDGTMAFVNCRWLFVQTENEPPSLKVFGTAGHVGRVTGLPYPVGSNGMVLVPSAAVLHDVSVIPATPGDPHVLPAVLSKLLPAPPLIGP